MPREFTSRKAIRNHAELTGYVYLWEGTHAFTTRRLLLSPDQYEIVDVRTDRGMRRAMLFPAYGSHLGLSTATMCCRMRASICDTLMQR
jgi:hypothetical protein